MLTSVTLQTTIGMHHGTSKSYHGLLWVYGFVLFRQFYEFPRALPLGIHKTALRVQHPRSPWYNYYLLGKVTMEFFAVKGVIAGRVCRLQNVVCISGCSTHDKGTWSMVVLL